MHDLETRLREVDPGGPPLGFDPDDVVTKAGKRLRARRAVVATVVVTLAVTAGAVYQFGSAPKMIAPAATSQPPGPGKALIPGNPSPKVASPHVNLTAQIPRNRQHLQQVIGGILVGARDITVGEFRQMYGPDDWDSITAKVSYHDAQGRQGTFNVTIDGPVAAQLVAVNPQVPCKPNAEKPGGVPPVCEKVSRPDGSTLVFEGVGIVDGLPVGKPVTVHDVRLGATIWRRDGESLNVFPGNGDAPSLTREQLTALVIDPAFTLR